MFALFILLLTSSSFFQHAASQQICNQHAEFCNRNYSEVVQIGAHDSAFVGYLPTDNQMLSVTNQLNAGIRFLQGQTHRDVFGTLSMCHTSCWELNAGTTVDYLTTIKRWLDANPSDVLTLLLTNGDFLGMPVFDTVFTQSGLKEYAFVPTLDGSTLGIDAWPTLGAMIASGKRIVVLMGECTAAYLLR